MVDMPVWSEPKDVRDRWLSGPLSVDDEQLNVLLADVEDAIESRFPDLKQLLKTGQLTERRLRRVIVRVATRVLRNPDGYRQVTSGTGPFTGSATYGGDQPGEVYITDEDREDLVGGAAPRGRRGAGNIFIGGIR